jgi:hypothetical protein
MADNLISAPFAPTQTIYRFNWARFGLDLEWYDGENPFPIPENWSVKFGKLSNDSNNPISEIWTGQVTNPATHKQLIDFPTPATAGIVSSSLVVMYRDDPGGKFPLLFLDIKTASQPNTNFAAGAAKAETIRFNWNGGNPFVMTSIGASAAEARLVALESQVAALLDDHDDEVTNYTALAALPAPPFRRFVMVNQKEIVDGKTKQRGLYLLFPSLKIQDSTGTIHRA